MPVPLKPNYHYDRYQCRYSSWFFKELEQLFSLMMVHKPPKHVGDTHKMCVYNRQCAFSSHKKFVCHQECKE